MKHLAAVLCIIVLAGCSDEPAEVRIKMQGTFSEAQADTIKRAMAAFEGSCVPLFEQYWGDVTSATATLFPHVAADKDGRETLMPLAEAYGWRRTLYLQITLSDHPGSIPSSYKAAGHTLHYHLGGGDKPGISAAKVQSALVCGWEPSGEGGDLHTDQPALKLIDEI